MGTFISIFSSLFRFVINFIDYWINILLKPVSRAIEYLIVWDNSARKIQQRKKESIFAANSAKSELEFTFLESLKYLLSRKKLSANFQINLFSSLKTATDFESPYPPIFNNFRWRAEFSPYERLVANSIYKGIATSALHECMEDTGAFSREYITHIKISEERQGDLASTYEMIINDIEEKKKRRRTAIFVSISPVGLLLLLLGSEITSAVYIVPTFTSSLDEDAIVPFTMKSYMLINDIVMNHKLEYTLKLIPFIVIFYLLSRLNINQVFFHWLILQFPGLKSIIQKWELSKFFNGITLLIKAGAPMQEAVDVSINLIGNRVVRASISEDLSDSDKQANLPDSLSNSIYVEPSVRNQLKYNRDRDLANTLEKISKEYEEFVKPLLNAPVKAITPFVTLISVIYICGRLLPLFGDLQSFFDIYTGGGN